MSKTTKLHKPKVSQLSDQIPGIDIRRSWLESEGVDTTKLDIHTYHNLAAFAGYISSIKDVQTYRDSSHTGDKNFTGTENFEDALELVLKPYGEPPVDIKDAVLDIEAKIRNNLHKKGLLTDWLVEDYHYDVEGVEIDIGKLIAGDAECYLKPNKKYKDHFYDLYINIGVAHYVTTNQIIEAFCNVIAVIVSLEKRGHKIRLFASSFSKDVSTDGRSSIINVCVKRYDEWINIKSIARIIYPSFLRRLIFKFEEVQYDKKLVSGYGLAINGLKGVITIDSALKPEELLNKIVAEHVAA